MSEGGPWLSAAAPLIMLCVVWFVFAGIIVGVILAVVNAVHRGNQRNSYLPYSQMPGAEKLNKGAYGERLTYLALKNFEVIGAKFLFNVYIPKSDSGTTELDIVMICHAGIFVFECKEFSGWIFGRADQKYWYQTLRSRKCNSVKNRFYNPVMQNRSHVKHLKAFLHLDIPIRSIIVFSDKCELKNVDIRMVDDITVVNLCNVYNVVSAILSQIPANSLTPSDVNNIYNILLPFTKLDYAAKVKHISDINKHINVQADSQFTKGSNFYFAKKSDNSFNSLNKGTTYDVSDQDIGTKDSNASYCVNSLYSDDKRDGISPNICNEKEIDTSILGNLDSRSDLSSDIEPKNDKLNSNLTSGCGSVSSSRSNMLKCPLCNGHLVLRTAKRGLNAGNKFYGCSNYPECRYIKNIGN